MLNRDHRYILKTVLEICDRHMQRMQYARDSLKNIFPTDTKSFKELSMEQVSRTDQLIYRFS
jgi:hypothetical protein